MINKEGYLIIRSERTRFQALNLADCMDKLRFMVREANKPLLKLGDEEITGRLERYEIELQTNLRISSLRFTRWQWWPFFCLFQTWSCCKRKITSKTNPVANQTGSSWFRLENTAPSSLLTTAWDSKQKFKKKPNKLAQSVKFQKKKKLMSF